MKNGDKEKYVNSGIGFDGKGSCSFNDGTGRNVIIFGVDNSLSPDINNLKNDFLILGKGDTFEINDSFGIF